MDAGGGGTLSGGGFTLTDTAGQAEAGVMTGGGFTLVGGFWGISGAPCPADIDGDGVVAVPDLLVLLAAWGTNPGGPPDFDGDGVVAVPDLLTLLAAWGACQ